MNDYLMRLFDGEVTASVDSEDNRNPFRGGYQNYFNEDTSVFVYQVRTSQPELPEYIVCFSERAQELGAAVRGAYCRKNLRSELGVGVLLDELFLSEMNTPHAQKRLEEMIEYVSSAVTWNLSGNRDTVKRDFLFFGKRKTLTEESLTEESLTEESLTEESLTEEAVTDRTPAELLAWIQGMDWNPGQGDFYPAEVVGKYRAEYQSAWLSVKLQGAGTEADSFSVSCKVPHVLGPTNMIRVFVCRGWEEVNCLHVMPLSNDFSRWYGRLEERQQRAFSAFVSSVGCRVIGQALYYSGKNGMKADEGTIRVMFHSTFEPLQPISMARFPEQIKIKFKTTTRHFAGDILTVQVNRSESGNLRCVERRAQFGGGDSAGNLNDNGNSLTGTAPDEEVDDGGNGVITGLFLYREAEIMAAAEQKTPKFDVNTFQTKVMEGRIGPLQYDLIEMIGCYQYATTNMLYRLVLSGYLPTNPYELSPAQTELVAMLRPQECKTPCSVLEGDSIYEMQLTRTSQEFVALMKELQQSGLVAAKRFKAPRRQPTNTNVLVLRDAGGKLMRALRRNGTKVDEFAFAYPVRWIKEILSVNQLNVVYICALNQRYAVDPDIKMQKVLSAADCHARFGYCMTLRSRQNNAEVDFLGESVRNTVGASKACDDMDINEKMPRLLHVANELSKENEKHTVLTVVYASYDEMKERARDLWEVYSQMDRSEYFHLYLTYDMLTAGSLEGMHFVFDETGALKREAETEKMIDSYFA